MIRKTKRTRAELLGWLDQNALDPVLKDAAVPGNLKKLVQYTKMSLHTRAYDAYSILSYFWSAQAQTNGKRVWRQLQQYGYPGFEGLADQFARYCGETPWKR